MTNFNTLEPWLHIELEKPTKEQEDSFYEGKIRGSKQASVFRKAIITKTFSEAKFPLNSVWMIGDSDPMEVNFFGERILLVQEMQLYDRVE